MREGNSEREGEREIVLREGNSERERKREK